MPQRLIFFALFIYAFFYLLFESWITGCTIDEPYYLASGLKLFSGGEPNIDVPPLSLWINALLPFLFGKSDTNDTFTLFLARLPHVLIFLGGGLFAAHLVREKAGERAALLFALFYTTCTSLKATAGLAITDSDSTVFSLLGTLLLWGKDTPSTRTIATAVFFFALACLSKLTGLVFTGLCFLHLCYRKPKESFRYLKLGLGIFLIIFLVIYRLRPTDLSYYFAVIKFQAHHGSVGHVSSFFGNFYDKGFWYYYLVSGFFKLSPFFTACFLWTVWHTIKKRPAPNDLFYIWGISLVLFILLSRGKAQVGFRYYFPALLLLTVATSIELSRIRKNWVFFVLGLTLVFADAKALLTDTPLTYFNFLTPRPSWNFADSNIDWGQGIPRHLVHKEPPGRTAGSIPAFLEDEGNGTAIFKIPAAELNFLRGTPFGVVFRSLPSFLRLSSNEYFELDRFTLFHALKAKEPFQNYNYGSFKPYAEPWKIGGTCQGKTSKRLRSQELFKEALAKGVAEAPPKDSVFEGTFTASLPAQDEVLILVLSGLPLDLTVDGVKGAYARSFITYYGPNFSYWMTVKPSQASVPVHFLLGGEKPSGALPVRVVAFWEEC